MKRRILGLEIGAVAGTALGIAGCIADSSEGRKGYDVLSALGLTYIGMVAGYAFGGATSIYREIRDATLNDRPDETGKLENGLSRKPEDSIGDGHEV